MRDGDSLRAAFDATDAYLAPPPGDGWNPASHVPEMPRRFRTLSIWCALRADGREGYRAMVERCVDNARMFGDWIERTPGLEPLAPMHLNVLCFRIRPDGADPETVDAINHEATIALQAGGQPFVSPTVWDGKAAIRSAFDNWATQAHDVDRLCAAIADEVGRAAR